MTLALPDVLPDGADHHGVAWRVGTAWEATPPERRWAAISPFAPPNTHPQLTRRTTHD